MTPSLPTNPESPLRPQGLYRFRGCPYTAIHLVDGQGEHWRSTALVSTGPGGIPDSLLYLRHATLELLDARTDAFAVVGTLADLEDTGKTDPLL